MGRPQTVRPDPVTAIAIINRDLVLAELRKGKRLSDIAPMLGLDSIESISKALKRDPEYREALEDSFEVRIDKAEDQIQAAPEMVDVSRARAYHDAIKWRAGVEVAERWSQKQTINQTVTHRYEIDVSDVARRIASLMQADAASQLPQSSMEITDAVIVEDQGNT